MIPIQIPEGKLTDLYRSTKMEKKTETQIEMYLKPTFAIDSENKNIVETATRLTQNCSSDEEKAVKLFYFVRDSIPYSIFMISVFIEDFRASRILEWGKGYCVQKAVLLTALARAAVIPTRLVFAKIANHRTPRHITEKLGNNIFPRHGYNQFFLDGRWLSAAATFNKDLCEKNGLPTVEFDGKKDAILPEKDLKGEPYIEYLEKFPPEQDLPFDWIARKIIQRVGPDKRAWPEKTDETKEGPFFDVTKQ